MTVAVENAYLPFNYIPVNETEGQGWDYDAWRHICGLLNCEPDFVESAWDPMIDQVSQGAYDAAADGISITDERKAKVDYSDPYMVVEQKFIVQLNDDRYATADDITADPEAIVATQVATTNYDLVVGLIGADRVQAFDQFGLAVQALIAGDVDAVIIDDAAGLGYVGKNAESIKTLEPGSAVRPTGVHLPQGLDPGGSGQSSDPIDERRWDYGRARSQVLHRRLHHHLRRHRGSRLIRFSNSRTRRAFARRVR